MTKAERLRVELLRNKDWIPFLLRESGLPGSRAHIELAQVVADEGSAELFETLLTFTPDCAPTNSPEEFLAFCGVVGLGRLLAEGDRSKLERLRFWANDPRWRVREAVAMALQRFGAADIHGMLEDLESWIEGSWYEQRAAMAAVCEPVLLGTAEIDRRVIGFLERLTSHIAQGNDGSDCFKALRQALGYGWSVVIASDPELGKPAFERWLDHPNRDVRRIVKENLTKKRLVRMDPVWTAACLERITARSSA